MIDVPKSKAAVISVYLLSFAALIHMSGRLSIAQTTQVTTHTQPPAEFDVASVRPSAPGNQVPIIHPTMDGLRATACTLRELIGFAYGPIALGEEGITGGPAWVRSDRYDVAAKVGDSGVDALKAMSLEQRDLQMQSMLQRLLLQRFHLTVHTQDRMIPSYELVVLKKTAKLHRSETVDPDLPNGALHMKRGEITGKGVSLARLAGALSQQMHQPVADHTGLTGTFDFALDWQPEDQTSDAQTSNGIGSAASPGTYDPSMLTALREQLGLQLASIKTAVKVTVIDHAERPTEN
jgi:uncharacterized protein (TIGR03435 family)